MKILSFSFLFLLSLAAHSQLITDSLLIEKHYRSFSYFKPATSLNNGSLMFVMHGSGGSNTDVIKRTEKLESIAAQEKLLVVYPNGYQHYWNECRKFSTAVANKEDINEGAFFTAMINYFNSKYGISKKHVFASGFSG